MPRAKPFDLREQYSTATGATTQATFPVPTGIIKFVEIGFLTESDEPVRVALDIDYQDEPGTFTIAAGWIRSPSSFGSSGAILEHMDIPIPQATVGKITIRNDTGAVVNVVYHIVGVRRRWGQ